MTAADKINNRLREGGIVQVTTCTRSTLYRQKHTGWFFMDKKNNLMVKSGRRMSALRELLSGSDGKSNKSQPPNTKARKP